jgi:hypothetical protein
MDPVSDTEFGFENTCTYAEFLDVLYRISGKPDVGTVTSASVGWEKSVTGKYAPAVQWAIDNDLISPAVTELGDGDALIRKDAAVTLFRFAKLGGYDTTVDEAQASGFAAQYPNLTQEELDAICWSYMNSIMRGTSTLGSVYELATQDMTRYYIVSIVYNFYLYFIQEDAQN